MKTFFFIGIVIFLWGSFYFYKKLPLLEFDNRGEIVQMEIVKLPTNCPFSSKKRYFVTFRFKEQLYRKQFRGNFCENHDIGQFVPMKYLPGSKEIMRPNESGKKHVISLAVLALLGLVLSITQGIKIIKK